MGVRVAALLRGINIGSSKRVSMPDLCAIVESLGHGDVETYLQSGNVVFTPAKGAGRDLAPGLEQAIGKATGLDVPVLVRTGRAREGRGCQSARSTIQRESSSRSSARRSSPRSSGSATWTSTHLTN